MRGGDGIPQLPHTVLHLRHDDLHLDIAPEIGGSFVRCYSLREGTPLHWLRPASEDALREREPLGLASFPMAPWCNRIRNGLSFFGARPVRLPPNGDGTVHSIHGTSWRQPWQVTESGESHAVLVQSYTPPEIDGWPYEFDAEQRIRLDREGVSVEMSVTNRASDPMPAGLGHHPYFPHTPGTMLTVQVGAMWASDADLLPMGLAVPPLLNRLAQRVALSELDLDNNFVGWSHEARVDWLAERRALVLRADPPLDYFVLYCPQGKDHFVMEAVSNCTDWMNLAEKGETRAGGTVLKPGETLRGRFRLQPLFT